MSHQVALSFEDGVTRFITCAEDQTVADASYRARINIPLDCRDGACGTCKARCESGEYDGGAYLEDALSAAEAEEGYVLPCSMKPRTDLVLQIASTSAVAKTRAATYTGTITALERLSATTVAVSMRISERDQLVFLPGQYVNVAVPGTDETRSYSFSSGPQDETLAFLVKVTPGGVMSTYLTERAAVGDELSFTGPHGSFFLRETERPALLLAGGTGLAPILSILRTLQADGSSRPVHLVYGVSTDEDLVELDTLRELAASIEGLTWDHCVSDPATTAAHQGYVMSLIAPEHLYGGDVAVYLCGPPPMVEAVRGHFAEAGIEPTGFYYEKFALSGAQPAAEAPGAPAPAPAAAPAAPVAPVAPAPVEPEPTRAPEPVAEGEQPGVAAEEARSVAGQVMLPAAELAPLGASPSTADDDPAATARTVAGQRLARAGGDGPVTPLDPTGEPGTAVDARAVAGQQMLRSSDDLAPVVAAPVVAAPVVAAPVVAAPVVGGPARSGPDGYEIGEEHPSVHQSDAIFEARQALELGALELTINRLSHSQVAGYRLLAESTVPYVDGDRFVDAAAYTESNAAFHDYLFTLTGNDHLLQAYQALGVKGHMEDVLRHATWCHPRCTQDHLDIVDAVEAGDRHAARRLIVEHADRSKATMRRAMDDARHRVLPKFISPGRFEGKVVVVTGAAQGIGEATARRISAEGGVVVLADRADLVADLATELSSAARPAYAVLADLETWEGAEHLVHEALTRFGRIDVLVNNVGGAINFKPFTEFTAEEIRAEVTRSLMTTLYACRAALPSMVGRGRGVVVNVSSAATRGIHRIPYSAAKGAVNALTASLALEYAEHGIRVVGTAPGGTEAPPRRVSRGTPTPQSPEQEDWFQRHIDQTLGSSLMKRYGTLDEQAAAITFLASDEASYITGTVLPVAGGDLG